MLTYIVSLLVAWLCWKLFTVLKEWHTKRSCLAGIPIVDGHHWFFGILHKVHKLGDFWDIFLPFIERRTPRWFVYWNLFLSPSLCPTHPESVQAVLTANGLPKNHGLIGAYRMFKPWIGDGLLVSNGAKWARNRRLLTPAFHFDILKPYVGIFNEVADTFMGRLSSLSKDGASFDIFPLVGRATLQALLRCTLSYGDDTIQTLGEKHPYVSAIHRIRLHVAERVITPLFFFDVIYHRTSNYREFKKLCDYVHAFSTDIIAERRKTIEKDPSELEKRHLDFVDILITARDEEGAGLTDKEIQDEVDTFMFEGHDTTASAVSWALYSMAKYPEMRKKIRDEVSKLLNGRQRLTAEDLGKLPYTTCFIKETMRMYTPVPGTSRQLDKPCTIDGIYLPAGQVIDILPHAVHHNPAVWENHWEFKPERFLPEHMENKHPFAFTPFAAGQRNCIGQHFAMNEIKILICKIAERFELTPDPEIEAIPLQEFVMGSKNGIHLYVKDRTSKLSD